MRSTGTPGPVVERPSPPPPCAAGALSCQLDLPFARTNVPLLTPVGKCFQPFRSGSGGFIILCWGTHGQPERCDDAECPRRRM
jgi:hypothetical protein